MKKLLSLGALWLSVIIGFVAVGHSATTCARSDMYCYESGPTASLTTIGRLDSSGNLTVVGNETVAGNSTTGGITVLSPVSQITVSTKVPVGITGTYEQIQSTGGTVEFTSSSLFPAITTATAVSGQQLTLDATSQNNVVIIDTGPATAVSGSDAYIVISSTKSAVTLIYNATLAVWKEIGKQL